MFLPSNDVFNYDSIVQTIDVVSYELTWSGTCRGKCCRTGFNNTRLSSFSSSRAIMALPYIISWATSAAPIESTSSSDSSSARAAQSRVKSLRFPVFLGDKEIGAQHKNNDPFTRHHKYYFKDGNITFLVRPCLIICNSTYCYIQGQQHPLLCPPTFFLPPFKLLLHQA